MAERYAWKILSLWNVCEIRTEFYILQLKPIIEICTCAVGLHGMCEIFRNKFFLINFRFFVLFSVTPKWFLAEQTSENIVNKLGDKDKCNGLI